MSTAEPQMVLVVWEDAYAPDIGETWVAAGEFAWKPLMVKSVGFLLHDLPEGVVLTDSLMPDYTGQRSQIPRGMVRSVTVLSG